jgi:acetoin utilization deacetylase AcuC-like enzyme
MNNNQTKVGYIYSASLVQQLDKIERIKGRSQMVTALHGAYNLFDKVKLITPLLADTKILKTFHSQEYLSYLNKCSTVNDAEKLLNDTLGIIKINITKFEFFKK